MSKNKILQETKSPEEVSAENFIEKYLLPNISNLISIILYGWTLTWEHRNWKKESDIDLLVVTKWIINDKLKREDLIHKAYHKNIHLFFEEEVWQNRKVILGCFLRKIKVYKVLYGIDYLKEYLNYKQ